jgi:hypothetical protein
LEIVRAFLSPVCTDLLTPPVNYQRTPHRGGILGTGLSAVPSKLQLFWAKWIPLLAPDKVYTRADIASFWDDVKQRWRERRWFQIPPHRVAMNLFRDAQLSLLFFFHMILAR